MKTLHSISKERIYRDAFKLIVGEDCSQCHESIIGSTDLFLHVRCARTYLNSSYLDSSEQPWYCEHNCSNRVSTHLFAWNNIYPIQCDGCKAGSCP